MYRYTRPEVPLTKNGKWNKDKFKTKWWGGGLVPIIPPKLTPAEIKRKAKAKRAKQARKINYAYNRLTKEQLKRRSKTTTNG